MTIGASIAIVGVWGGTAYILTHGGDVSIVIGTILATIFISIFGEK